MRNNTNSLKNLKGIISLFLIYLAISLLFFLTLDKAAANRKGKVRITDSKGNNVSVFANNVYDNNYYSGTTGPVYVEVRDPYSNDSLLALNTTVVGVTSNLENTGNPAHASTVYSDGYYYGGTIENIVTGYKTKNENWKVQCVYASHYYSDRFSVTGSLSGPNSKYAYSGSRYVTKGGEVRFTISEGSEPFSVGDTYYFDTFAASVVSESLVLTETAVNSGVFTATISIDDSSGIPSIDGDIDVLKSDTITAIYDDLLNPSGSKKHIDDADYVQTVLSCSKIITDTLWTKENSPYFAPCGITVKKNVTLTIEPGVVVIFRKGYTWLRINGILNAQGTPADHIVFTSDAKYPKKSDWEGIRFYNKGSGTVKNCEVRYAYMGIYAYRSSPVVSDNIISDNYYGMYFNRSGNYDNPIPISNNDISNNKYGIHLYHSSADINGNIISDNYYFGISSSYSSGLISITGNTITNNGHYNSINSGAIVHYDYSGNGIYSVVNNNISSNSTGIRIEGSSQNVTINYNNIYENPAYDFLNYSSNDVNVRFNYWGTANTAEMNSGNNPKNILAFYDGFDYSYRGIANYSGWLDNYYDQGGQPSQPTGTTGQVRLADSNWDDTFLYSHQLYEGGYYFYETGDSVHIEVTDPDENKNPLSLDTIAVGITSDLEDTGTPAYASNVYSSAYNHGAVENIVTGYRTKTETWSLVCTSASPFGNDRFSVTGSVSGLQQNSVFSEVPYFTKSGEVGFTIREGEGKFSVGDTLTFNTTSAVVVSQALTLTETDVNSGIFRGTIPLDETSGVPAQDSDLDINRRDRVTVIYNDLKTDWGIGQNNTIKRALYVHTKVNYNSINSDTVWTASNSPYYVPDSISVNTGNTLTIQPGVEVLFRESGNNRFNVYGTLKAEGSPSNHIIFTSASEFPFFNDWRGFYLNYSNNSSIKYCEISYSNYGVYAYRTNNLSIAYSKLFCNNYGIYGYYCNPIISNNVISDNYTGIYLRSCTARIIDNWIKDNRDYGIYYYYTYSGLPLYITGNVIKNRGFSSNNIGIYLYDYSNHDIFIKNNKVTGNVKGIQIQSSNPNIKINYNDILGNYSYDFYNASYSNIETDIRFNYWGTATTSEMNSGNNPKNISSIYDRYDNSSSGLSDYSSWLSDSFDNGGVPNNTGVSGQIRLTDSNWNDTSIYASKVYGSGYYYGTPENIYVELIDSDENQNTNAVEYATVSLTSGKENTGTLSSASQVYSSAYYHGTLENIVTGVTTKTETWTVKCVYYSSYNSDKFSVTGSVSGTQINQATPGVNYYTDNGDVGFVIREGPQSFYTGDTFTFNTYAGTTVSEPLILKETGNDTGVFRGSISIDEASATPNLDGDLDVLPSDRIIVIYGDLLDEWGQGKKILDKANYAHTKVECASISGNTVWSAAESPYFLTCNVTVNSGAVLTIEPGVTLLFQSGKNIPIYVNGTLNAEGTSANHIVFKSSSDISGVLEEWYGIRFNNGSNGIIKYCEISNSTYGITSYFSLVSVPEISHNIISYNYYGIYLYGNPDGNITNITDNTITKNTYGIYSSSKTLNIMNNEISGNKKFGIYFYNPDGTTQIIGNNILNNGDSYGESGILISGYGNNPNVKFIIQGNNITGNGEGIIVNNNYPNIIVSYNNIYDNNIYDVQNYSTADLNMRGNYWGVVTTQEMNSGNNPKNITAIYDGFDSSYNGLINYSGWLTSPYDGSGNMPPLPGTSAQVNLAGSNWDKIDAYSSKVFEGGYFSATSGRVYAEVSDPDENKNPSMVDTIVISLTSGLEDTGTPAYASNVYSSGYYYSGTIENIVTGYETKTETWTLLCEYASNYYSSDRFAVGGSVSGIQKNKAFTGSEYISDNGEVSFTIKEGTPRFSSGDVLKFDTTAAVIVSEPVTLIETGVNTGVFRGSIPTDEQSGVPAPDGDLDVLPNDKVTLLYDDQLNDWGSKERFIDSLPYAHTLVKQNNITQNTTWSIANSPYYVTGSVTIAQNAVLTTEPGVEVLFKSKKYLAININGTLNAVGTPSNHIVFRSNADIPKEQDWNGIVFNSGSTGTLKFCEIRDANYGVYVYNSVPIISDNIIFNNHMGIKCILYNSIDSLNISNNEIKENRYGISIQRGSATISGNTISGNIHTGVLIQGYIGTVSITQNTIINNGLNSYSYYGIYIYSYDINANITISNNTITGNSNGICAGNYISNLTINYNNIYDNGYYDYRNDTSYDTNVRFNYWGMQTTQEMNTGANPKNISAIYDGFDYSYDGSANYSGWLDAPFDEGGSPPSLTGTSGQVRLADYSWDDIDAYSHKVFEDGYLYEASGIVYAEVSDPDENKNLLVVDSVVIGLTSELEDTGTPAYASNVYSSGYYSFGGTVQNIVMEYATKTETWTLFCEYASSYNSDRFKVTGSVSGEQNNRAYTGTEYVSANGEVRFTIKEENPLFSYGDILKFDTTAASIVSEPVTLTETGENTGVFRGSIPTDDQSGVPSADGDLDVYPKDTVTLVYDDLLTDWGDKEQLIKQAPFVRTIVRCGNINQDTVWSKADSPYLVTCNITVNNGATLTIEPGVEVYFQPGKNLQLEIRGTIIAQGNGNMPILFTSSSAYPKKQDWYGIRINYNNNANLLEYCEIKYANSGVYVSNSSATILNSLMSNNRNGIYSYRSSPKIKNNQIVDCEYGIYVHYDRPSYDVAKIENNHILNNNYGIYLSSSSPQVLNNVVADNKKCGIYFRYAPDDLLVSNNAIMRNGKSSNGYGGIYIYGYSSGHNYNIESNSISENKYGIYIANSSNTFNVNNNNVYGNTKFDFRNNSTANVDAKGNYWGVAVTQEMQNKQPPLQNISSIYDHFDYSSRGTVDYNNWLNVPILLPPAGVTATRQSPSILVQWTKNEAATGYRIYYGMLPGNYDNYADVGNVDICVLTDLLADIPYYVAVTSMKGTEETGYSEEVVSMGGVDNGILINKGENETNNRNVSLILWSKDNPEQMMISENSNFAGAQWEAFSLSRQYELSASEGDKPLYAKFKNSDGNILDTLSDNIVLDTTPPSASVLLEPSSPVRAETITVTLSVSENLPEAPLLSFTPSGNSPIPVSGLTKAETKKWTGQIQITENTGDGSAQFSFSGEDSAGNIGTDITEGNSFVIDTQSPGMPLSAEVTPNPGGKVTLMWQLPNGEVPAYYNIYISTSPITSTFGMIPSESIITTTYSYKTPQDGTYYYAVTSVDSAGNESVPIPNISATSDSVAPDEPSGLIAEINPGNNVVLSWTTAQGETPSSYNIYRQPGTEIVSIDGLSPVNNVSVITATDKASDEGLNYYVVTSLDTAGNESGISNNASVVADLTPPLSSITPSIPWYFNSDENRYVANIDTAYALSAIDNISGVDRIEYSLKNGELPPSEFNVYTDTLSLSPGNTEHIIYMKAVDNMENWEEEQSTKIFIDTTPPTTTISLTDSGCGDDDYDDQTIFINTETVITFSIVDDEGAEFTEYKISDEKHKKDKSEDDEENNGKEKNGKNADKEDDDGDEGEWTEYLSGFTITEEGEHTIYYRSTDKVFNEEVTNSVQVFVDASAPSSKFVKQKKFTTDIDKLRAEWKFKEKESNISEYQYCVGTSPGSDDIVGWTGNENNDSAEVSNLQLSEGVTYYFSVKALNCANLWSDVATSDGTTVIVKNDDPDDDDLCNEDELNKYYTNPFNKDSDGDGFNDGLEVNMMSNPNDPSSKPGRGPVANPFGEAPIVSNLTPESVESWSNLKTITWEASDPDGDSLTTDIYYCSGNCDGSWNVIDSGVSGKSYDWDTKTVPDGGYMLKVSVSDGKYNTETESSLFFIINKGSAHIVTNPSGAKIFIDGNYAYPGIYSGTSEASINGIKAGNHFIRITYGGFNDYFTTIKVNSGETVEVSANLVPQKDIVYFGSDDIEFNNLPLFSGEESAPFAVDWNNDGIKDLIVGNKSGEVKFYQNSGNDSQPLFSSEEVILYSGSYCVPFVVDWNNDGIKDLITGNESGNILLYINAENDESPTFSNAEILLEANDTNAVPFVIDWNDDNRKDLIVGFGSGKILFYENKGSDETPSFNDGILIVKHINGMVSPFAVTDWNGDGSKDILVGDSTGDVYLYINSGTGEAPSFINVEKVLVGDEGNSKIFVIDWNNDGINDILYADNSGKISLFSGTYEEEMDVDIDLEDSKAKWKIGWPSRGYLWTGFVDIKDYPYYIHSKEKSQVLWSEVFAPIVSDKLSISWNDLQTSKRNLDMWVYSLKKGKGVLKVELMLNNKDAGLKTISLLEGTDSKCKTGWNHIKVNLFDLISNVSDETKYRNFQIRIWSAGNNVIAVDDVRIY